MQKIEIEKLPQNLLDYLNIENNITKHMLYSDFSSSIYSTTTYYSDGINCSIFRINYRLINYGKNITLKPVNKIGIWYKDGKVNNWTNNSIATYFNDFKLLSSLFEIKNWNFIDKRLYPYINKTNLTGLFKGKITNPIQLLDAYIKSAKLKTITPKVLYKTVMSDMNIDKYDLYKFCIVDSKNNGFIKWFTNSYVNNSYDSVYNNNYKYEEFNRKLTLLKDLQEQFIVLNRKINYDWSYKRLMYEHEMATNEMMKHYGNDGNDEVIDLDIPYIESFLTLLSSKKEVYREGYHMKHCIFTNYWARIKNKTYIAFEVRFENERATLGCDYDNLHNKMTFNQVYSYKNGMVSKSLRNSCFDYVAKYNELHSIKGNLSEESRKEEFQYLF